jgi:hypothetical protein
MAMEREAMTVGANETTSTCWAIGYMIRNYPDV